eukprot:04519.XXX_146533_146850_1 [CDS] Oithona nana genome sequencing.
MIIIKIKLVPTIIGHVTVAGGSIQRMGCMARQGRLVLLKSTRSTKGRCSNRGHRALRSPPRPAPAHTPVPGHGWRTHGSRRAKICGEKGIACASMCIPLGQRAGHH